MRSRGTIVAIIIIVTVLLDQIIKIAVKTSFYLGEDMPVFHGFICCSLRTMGWHSE